LASFRKGLTLGLGPVAFQVDLETVTPDVKSPFHRYCPEHHARIRQSNRCTAENHEVTSFVLGAETAEGLRIVEPEDRPQVEADDALSITVVPANEVEGVTRAGHGFYYAKPSNSASEMAWTLVSEFAADKKLALIARGALRRGSPKLWRIESFRGHLVLTELVFPENIKEAPEAPTVKVDSEMRKLMKQLVGNMTSTITKIDTVDQGRASLEAWVETGKLVTEAGIVEAPKKDNKAQLTNLMDTLKAAVEGSK
jgi:non-homologous end joining protein Ku